MICTLKSVGFNVIYTKGRVRRFEKPKRLFNSTAHMGCFTRCCAKAFGVIFIVLGISSTVFVGVLFPKQFAPTLLRVSVEHAVIFTPSDVKLKTSNYDRFIGGKGEPNLEMETGDQEMVHNFFYIYNVSNPKDFITGTENPKLDEIGPFGYGIVSRRYNITFEQDLVSFSNYWFAVPLSTETCKTDLTQMEHPEPMECLDPTTTTVTTLNPSFAGALHDQDPNVVFATIGAKVIEGYIDGFHQFLGHGLAVNSMGSITNMQKTLYASKFGVDMVYGAFESVKAANGNSHNNAVLILNNATLITDHGIGSESPLAWINGLFASLSIAQTDHVFADPALLSQFFNASSTFSPFNPLGLSLWANGFQAGVQSQLAGVCATTSTTNCLERIQAIYSWIMTFAQSSTAREAQYNDFVTQENSFACLFLSPCDWNLKTHLKYNGQDADPPSQALYENVFDPSSPISLLTPGGNAMWGAVDKYCQNPTMNCTESANIRNAYLSVLNMVATLDSSSLAAVQADPALSASYLGQLCSVAKYSDHLLRSPILGFMLTGALKNSLFGIGVLTADEAAAVTSLRDITIHELATGKMSNIMFGAPYLSPTEPFVWIDATISLPILREVFDVFTDPTKLYTLVMKTFSRGTTEYQVNTEATYDDLVSVSTAAFLQTAQGNGTVASAFVEFLQGMITTEVFMATRTFCDDLADCDYAKGGLFTTVTADQYLFTGYSDAGTVLLADEAAGEDYKITCRKPKYYYADGKTSGSVEDSENVFIRTDTCTKVPDSDCTDGGIRVTDVAAGTTHDWYMDENDAEATGRYYRMDLDFTIGDVTISPLVPVFANAFGKTFLDIDYQQHRDCGMDSDCTTVINTGKKNISNIGEVEMFHGQTESLEWPQPVAYAGSVTGQFAPRFMKGLKSDECPKDIDMFIKNLEYYPFTFGLDKRTTIDYEIKNVVPIDVCRYAMNQESYDAMISFINQDASVLPPNGMLPLPPGVNATKPAVAMISSPSFLWDKEFNNGAELSKFEGLNPDPKRHGNYVDVEQSTGTALRVLQRIGFYMPVKRSALFPNLKENQYSFPTSSFTLYATIKETDATLLGNLLAFMRILPKYTETGGFAAGGVFLILGMICCYKGRKKAPAGDNVKPT